MLQLPVLVQLLVLCLISLLLPWCSNVALGAALIPSIPPPSNATIEVQIYGFIEDFGIVDAALEGIEIDYDLFYSWEDARLPDAIGGVSLSSIWHPAIYESNVREKEHEVIYQDVWVKNGTVWVWRRAQGLFTSQFDISEFWHDSHTVYASFHSAIYFKNDVVLKKAPNIMGHRYHDLVNDDAFLPSWTVEDVYADVENEYFDPARQKYSTFKLKVDITRDISFYVVSVFLPFFIVMAFLNAVFWIPIERLDYRVQTIFTAVLAVVAYNFVLYQSLPKVSYTTNFDKFVLWSFGLLFLVSLETLFVHEYRMRNKWKPLRVHLRFWRIHQYRPPPGSDAVNPKHLRFCKKVDLVSRLIYPALLVLGVILFLT